MESSKWGNFSGIWLLFGVLWMICEMIKKFINEWGVVLIPLSARFE